MKTGFIVAAILGLAAGAVTQAAQADGIESLRGRFAFDWKQDPNKARCAAVGDALLGQFKSPAFVCDLTVRKNSASNAPFVSCKAKAGRPEYLIFATAALCKGELETQRANGD